MMSIEDMIELHSPHDAEPDITGKAKNVKFKIFTEKKEKEVLKNVITGNIRTVA